MKRVPLFVLLVFFCVQSSYGYFRELWEPDLTPGGISWDDTVPGTSNFFDNGSLVYRVITDGTYAVSSNSFQMAIEHAVQTWEDIPDATLTFSRGTDITVDSDEDLSVGLSTEEGDTQWGGNIAGVAALTTISYVEISNAYYIVDADVSVNSGEEPSVDGSSYLDMERVVIHEFGHVLGLTHSPHPMSELSYVTGWIGTSYIGETEGRRLTEDDKLGATVIYPSDSFTNKYGSLAGYITLDGSDVHMAQVAAYDADGVVVAVTLSSLGLYHFEALPVGQYTVRAFETFTSGDGLHHLYGSFASTIENLGSPTAFVTTEDNDEPGVDVAAGQLSWQDLYVSEGTSSMKVLYALAEGDDGYNANSRVLRIKRGETLSIGLLGTNIPSSTMIIGELSISGSGVSISGTDAEESSDEDHAGLNAITFDVAVDSDAECGPRDIVLNSLEYPDERYVVFGFIDVYDDPVVTVSDGPEAPAVRSFTSAQTNVVMAQLNLSCDTFDSARMRSVTVSHFGSGDASGVSDVRFYLDADNDGQVTPGDSLIGSGVFSSESIDFPLVKTISAGSNLNFLVVYDFNAGVHGTYACLIEDGGMNVSGTYSSMSLTHPGLPYKAAIIDFDISGSLVLSTGSIGNDFNGDRISDLAIFDGNSGYWYVLGVDIELLVYGVRWGWPGAVPVAGDYDGDGIADLALFDNLTGYWYIFTLDGSLLLWAQQWGWAGAHPVAGDYDGDGISDLAVYDDATGSWYILAVDGEVIAWDVQWGWTGATPVPGDYDADGTSDLAVYDTGGFYWFIMSLSEGVLTWGAQWGVDGSIPVPGDYDGDSASDLAVFHPETGYWFVRDVPGNLLLWAYTWGWSESIPIPGDYDGDGISDLAVFDDDNGLWYITTLEGEILAWDLEWGWLGTTTVSM